jgi:hypothetical protein
MIYIIISALLFVLLVIQNILADVLFLGRSPLEISLIVVIYMAFRLSFIKGALLSAWVGFVMDCITGTVAGAYVFIYYAVFSGSYFISRHLYGEKDGLIVTLVLLWGIVEGIILFGLKSLQTGEFAFFSFLPFLILKIVPLGVLGPFLFHIFDKLGFSYGFNERATKRP